MYYEYWCLKKPPFDNVPDPSMYVDTHDSMENAIAETLFAVEEGNDCLAVIVGDVGLGKTLSLRLIIDSLDAGKYRIALITNPDMSFPQLLREMIGQLTGAPCETKKKLDLLESFNRLLFATCEEGKKVLIFIDEANAIAPRNLESLRLLTNMQDDRANLFTIVLAGQKELAKRLEHPSRANLYQRIGTYCRIGKIDSPEKLKDYVETRLRQAGAGNGRIFTADAILALWEHSDEGVPRLINKLCKLCLKAGETNGFREIDGEIVGQVAGRFTRHESPRTGKGPRKKPQQTVLEVKPVETAPQVPAVPADPVPESPGIDSSLGVLPEAVIVPPAEPLPEAPAREAAPEPEDRDPGEAKIGNYRIRIDIPAEILQEAKASNPEYRTRMAGSLAAKTMHENPHLVSSPMTDPVVIWSQIKEAFLRRLGA